MNALRVVGDDFVLGPGVAHGSPLTLAVTARAKRGNVGGEGRRLRVLFAKDGMGAMAFLADRGIRIVLGNLLSVDADSVLLANLIVASGAVHRVGDGLTSAHAGGVYFRVALAASNFVVARMAHLANADVHGFPVARATQFLVGVATHAVRVGHTQFIEDVPDPMGLMAVRAGGQDVGLFFPKLSTNGLAVDRFDLGVAFRAGGGNVPAIDGGGGVGVRQDQVRGVARGAGRGHRQSLFQQRLAVDALGVVLENIVLANVAIARNSSSFAMALAANEGHFHWRHRRPRVLHRIDVVVPVTIHTAGRQWIAARNRLPVERAGMLLLLGGVARATLYRRRFFVR